MKALLTALALFMSITVQAAKLQPADTRLIADAGVPLFADASFVQGNKQVGFRFASSTPPLEVQKWYRQQLPKWSLFNDYGSWILHNGAPGIGMGEVMSKNQISIQQNSNLPEWHSLDKNMTTEIVIMIVE